jgi:alkylated DNA repair dioxygenase AlkB
MINGISLYEDFITDLQESALIPHLASEKKRSITSGGGLYQVRYGTNVYSRKLASEVIPEYLVEYCELLHQRGFLDHTPKHITINTYEKGSVIGPHIDKPDCGDAVTILSVASDATMMMSRGELREEITLKRRSLIQLAGEARFDWEHEVLPVASLRYSLVFRD